MDLSDPREAMPPRQPPIMLIDAYNVINLDPDLQALLQSGGDQLSFARAELEKRVMLYARYGDGHSDGDNVPSTQTASSN